MSPSHPDKIEHFGFEIDTGYSKNDVLDKQFFSYLVPGDIIYETGHSAMINKIEYNVEGKREITDVKEEESEDVITANTNITLIEAAGWDKLKSVMNHKKLSTHEPEMYGEDENPFCSLVRLKTGIGIADITGSGYYTDATHIDDFHYKQMFDAYTATCWSVKTNSDDAGNTKDCYVEFDLSIPIKFDRIGIIPGDTEYVNIDEACSLKYL